jgi:hypothetical protein
MKYEMPKASYARIKAALLTNESRDRLYVSMSDVHAALAAEDYSMRWYKDHVATLIKLATDDDPFFAKLLIDALIAEWKGSSAVVDKFQAALVELVSWRASDDDGINLKSVIRAP